MPRVYFSLYQKSVPGSRSCSMRHRPTCRSWPCCVRSGSGRRLCPQTRNRNPWDRNNRKRSALGSCREIVYSNSSEAGVTCISKSAMTVPSLATALSAVFGARSALSSSRAPGAPSWPYAGFFMTMVWFFSAFILNVLAMPMTQPQ